jgi:Nitrile hydratase, alpha chain
MAKLLHEGHSPGPLPPKRSAHLLRNWGCADFLERCQHEVRGISLLGSRVHKPCVLRDGLPVKAELIHTSRYKLGAARAKGEGTMTEASGGGGSSRAEMERKLIHRSLQDEDFRQRLLDDRKGTLEQELGTRLPEGFRVRVVEETAQTIYLVLPSASPLGQGEELSDQELEAVAGGSDTWLECGPVTGPGQGCS